MKIIRRYKNRKMYDTESSKYVTLKTLVNYSLDDVEFVVIDNVTSKDLTVQTLLQAFNSYANIDKDSIHSLINLYVGDGK